MHKTFEQKIANHCSPVWGSFCFICIFFVWSMIYETKGLSLEQVDELYAKVPFAWKSSKFVPTVSYQEVRDIGPRRGSTLADLEDLAIRKKSAQHDEGLPVANEKGTIE